VSQSTLKFLKQVLEEKGFKSMDELIFHCVKACEYYTKGQIILLSEIDKGSVRTAISEKQMYDDCKLKIGQFSPEFKKEANLRLPQ
jgi:hypothetical protein